MCGLTTGEIARVLLVRESTVAARITRGKQKIAGAGVPFRVPEDEALPERLDTVLTVVHLAYTAGHTASGDLLVRQDLTSRAVLLARLLVARCRTSPRPSACSPCCFAEARAAARLDPGGDLVLADQDRSRWDHALVNEGLALATRALARGDGRFTLQAAIAGLHMSAPSWEATDWCQLVRMYDALMVRWPSPVVALNRAAAASLVPGADLTAVLRELDALGVEPSLAAYPYLPAARADVLTRLGRAAEAGQAYEEALSLTDNEAERRFLMAHRRP